MAPKRPFSDFDWQLTPDAVKLYIQYLEKNLTGLQQSVQEHETRIEKLETRTRQNSQNSSKPPSSDPPYSRDQRKKKNKSAKSKGGQKGHKGHQQQMLTPDDTRNLMPESCSRCGHSDFTGVRSNAFYTHQVIEIPKIPTEVTHLILHRCQCPGCGKTLKAKVPQDMRYGYGPRLSAFVAELSGIKGMSRRDVSVLCQSVLGVPISTGAVQKILDRTSAALKGLYSRAGQLARKADVNYVDETSWFEENHLHWLWAMISERVAFYRIDPNRSKEAFKRLIENWDGVLVSDSYGLYRSWDNERQTCIAHLIRKAVAISEHKNKEIRYFGQIIAAMLSQLTAFAKDPPGEKQWQAFHRHLLFTLSLYEPDKTPAGCLARQIVRELDCLWTFRDHDGVDPTNNRAERALRYGVLWRKRSFGTHSEKGCRWVERILTFKETCRLKARATYPMLVDLIRAHFLGVQPDLAWL